MLKDFVIKLVFVEIYNEILRDLLNPLEKNLEIREDAKRGTIVSGA
jgi:centromeric protein E